MNSTRLLLVLSLSFVPVAVGCSHDDTHHDHSSADRTSGDEHADAHRTDGTHVSTRDTTHGGRADTVVASDTRPTAMDQGESASDVEITRQIRAAVVSDSSLSFGARNCVIITNGGHVTLRGDVTMAESAAIERHAVAAAGALHVTNDLHASDRAAAH